MATRQELEQIIRDAQKGITDANVAIANAQAELRGMNKIEAAKDGIKSNLTIGKEFGFTRTQVETFLASVLDQLYA